MLHLASTQCGWVQLHNGLLSFQCHLSFVVYICEDHHKPINKEASWICQGTRSMPIGNIESLGCSTSRASYCLRATTFLGQKTLNNIMKCCVILHVHDHRRWEGLGLETTMLVAVWSQQETLTGSVPFLRPNGCPSSRWSHSASLAAAWGSIRTCISIIVRWTIICFLGHSLCV
jgi:hypothetical protein